MPFNPKTFDNDIEVQGRISATVTLALGYPTIVGANKTIEAIGAGSDIRIDLIPKGASSVRLPSAYITRITDNEDVINKEYADKRLASKELEANLLAPGGAEDGFVVSYNHTTGKFGLVAGASGFTFGSGLENIGGAVKLGGTALDRHTEIFGAFDLRLGTAANKLANILGDVTTKVEFISPSSRLTLNGTNPLELVGGAASSSIIFDAGGGITLADNGAGVNKRGLRGAANYSLTVQPNDYVQKIYVDDRIAGKQVSALVKAPTFAQNQWSIVWDEGTQNYTLSPITPAVTAKRHQRFTADGIVTSFTVNNGVVDQVDFVEVNGNVQQLTIHYTVTLQVISFGVAPPAGSTVTVHYFDGLLIGSGTDLDLGDPAEIPYTDGSALNFEYNPNFKFLSGPGQLQTPNLNITAAPTLDNTLALVLARDPTSGDVKEFDIASIDHFKGVYISLAALEAAYPTANAGDFADVDPGTGSAPVRYIWDDTDNLWAEIGAGGGIGLTGRGYWRFSTLTSTPPTSGQIRFDNATMANVTKLYLHEISDEGIDTANFLETISVGDKFYVQQKNDSTRWMEAIVNAVPTDNGTWWEIPVTIEDNSGVLMGGNAPTLVRLTASGIETLSAFLTYYFTADGVTTAFTIPESTAIKILAVYVGGQRMQEIIHYNKNDATRTVTFTSVIAFGIGIDVEYVKGIVGVSGLTNWDESTFGLARKATQVEAEAATDNVGGITPLRLGQWWTATKLLPQTFKHLAHTWQTLTDAATIAWNGNLGSFATVTLAGNRTLGAITNPLQGALYILRVVQDATGNRTLAFNAQFTFGGSITPVLNTAANAATVLTFFYDGTNMRYAGASGDYKLANLYLSAQAAAGGEQRPLYIDSTGKIFKSAFVNFDETNKKATITGSSVTTITVFEVLNSALASIMKLTNDQVAEFGGPTAVMSILSSVVSGGAYIELNANQSEGFKIIDKDANAYFTFVTTTGGLAIRKHQKSIDDQGLGFEKVTVQAFLEGTGAASATQLITFVNISSDSAIDITINHLFAYEQTTGEVVVANGGRKGMVRNVAGTVSGAFDTFSVLASPATDANWSLVADNTNKRININYINPSTGGVHEIALDYSYILRPLPTV